ncbi:MAG: hypothetical protein ABW252_19555 [Polyangiales bacterium]
MGTSGTHALGRAEPLRRVLLYGLLGALILGIVTALLLAWLESAHGRELVRTQLEKAIGGGMAGSLEVAALEEIGFRHLRARGVTFRDPDGKPAIEVDRVRIAYDPMQVFGGALGFERADIDGCHVRVHEGKDSKVNMDKLFASKEPKKKEPGEEEKKKDGRDIDLRLMNTAGCTLDIGGGSLPELRMTKLEGVMRVRVLADGKVELRFDNYRGDFEKGLPTGRLLFREVAGWVEPGQAKLLHFDGTGKSEGAPVDFRLDILREPKKRVKIDAKFPTLSANAVRALAVAGFTSFSDTLEFNVEPGT